MPIVQQPTASRPAWIELGTTDPEAASAFYSALFGWTRHQVIQGGTSSYWVWRKNGLDVAGMYPIGSPLTDQGIPPHWLLYFGSEDVAASAAKVREAKGGLLFGPMDVGTAGRSAWFTDQHGAMFAVWQASGHIGFGICDEPGTICRVELVTPSFERSVAFYSHLFGWSPVERRKDTRRGPANCLEWTLGDRAVGSAIEMTPAWKGIPPHWMPYFHVEDCARAANTAQESGASLAHQPVSTEGVGTFVMLADPQGVHFSIIEPAK